MGLLHKYVKYCHKRNIIFVENPDLAFNMFVQYQFYSITELQNYLYHFHNLAPKNAQPQNSDDYFSYLTDFSYFSLEEKILKVKDTIRTDQKHVILT